MNAYFENMTSFSLFHRPSFDAKLTSISSPVQLQALVASMFSFSARFTNTQNSPSSRSTSPRHFYRLAENLTDAAVKDCADEVFPLCLLQSLILVNFQQLTEGVRGRAWRSIGTCVRIAYELQLHLVDKPSPNTRNSPNTSLDEEKRRAWWTIWEFDVFASTIRRLPTAIDWKENETWLPIDDELWFANSCVRSCKLDPDPAAAWKLLQNSGNKSAKAWFVVVNALMRCAHLLSYPQAYAAASSVEAGEVPPGLDVLANSLYCLSAALPTDLVYRGEFLKFSPGSLHTDSSKHGIHVMTQLSRFMINHYQVFDSTARKLGEKVSPTNSAVLTSLDQVAWNHYLNAASEIVSLIRNCPPSHVQYVNPFLASTIWLAAAAQVASKSFGSALVDSRVADSNLDVLQTNLNGSVSFWGVSDTLKINLGILESPVSNRPEEVSVQGSHTQAPNPRVPNTWMDRNEGYVHNMWADSRLDLNSSFVPDMNLNLWGWGMEELMNYGGIE
ncbi:fungal-specific transcription factor domain-containing protein [Leptodontidium sp. 2 PMI_412]|nr:fungal-specific transcription factor domain-containing protein [Leptodontidium sp. MPI-SDFR-AT-0119]KAH9217848.1 fungal-specific transcription factor domain-containing protein [Leptodontidium sp. 2 PMI_412]